jgi:hypothetical protein
MRRWQLFHNRGKVAGAAGDRLTVMGELNAAPATFMLNTWKIAGAIYFALRLFYSTIAVSSFPFTVLNINLVRNITATP